MPIKELLIASNNPGKIAEIQAILAPIPCLSQESLGLASVEETGLSFVENALIKARFLANVSSKPVLADDSGLIVEALNGEPGLHSARFAGSSATEKDNIKKLLDELKDIEDSKRQAYFYSVIVLLRHAKDPAPLIAWGRWDGFITQAPRGVQGFGYDPVFYLPTEGCTAAELAPELKNRLSHRAQALKALKKQLEECL